MTTKKKYDIINKYLDNPDETIWEKTDFNKFKESTDENPVEEDIWFVLKEYESDGSIKAKISQNLDKYEFISANLAILSFY